MLNHLLARAIAAGRDVSQFEPAMQMQLVLGRDRRAALEEVVRVPPAAAMALLMPGRVRSKHALRHPLGENYEGFPEFVPSQVTPEQIAQAQRQVTPDLLGDGVFAGNIDEIVSDVRALVDVGLRHVVIWNLGPLASGASVRRLLQLAVLIRRLRRLPLPNR